MAKREVLRAARSNSQVVGKLVDYHEATNVDEATGRVWDTMVFESGETFEVPSADRYDIGFELYRGQEVSARKRFTAEGRLQYDIREGIVDFDALDSTSSETF